MDTPQEGDKKTLFLEDLKRKITELKGDLSEDEAEKGVLDFYIPEDNAEEMDGFLMDNGYAYEGADRMSFAEPGGYMKFNAGGSFGDERLFMFRVTL